MFKIEQGQLVAFFRHHQPPEGIEMAVTFEPSMRETQEALPNWGRSSQSICKAKIMDLQGWLWERGAIIISSIIILNYILDSIRGLSLAHPWKPPPCSPLAAAIRPDAMLTIPERPFKRVKQHFCLSPKGPQVAPRSTDASG